MRLLSVAVVAVVCWLSAPVAAQPASKRQAQEREITLVGVDPPPPDVYVAGRRSTVLEFDFLVSKDGVRLTVMNPMPQLMVADKQLVLLPAEDIRTEEKITLVVDPPGGTPMRFLLRSRPDVFDTYIKVKWESDVTPVDAGPRKARGAVDDCQTADEVTGLGATVEAVLREEAKKKVAEWEARRRIPAWAGGAREVEPKAMTVYRTGDVLYVAVRLESTSPPWIPEGGTVASSEVGVLEAIFAKSRTAEEGKSVVNVLAVRAPPLGKIGRLSVELAAKDGRRVRVEEQEVVP